jgi:hypothetical protein
MKGREMWSAPFLFYIVYCILEISFREGVIESRWGIGRMM